LRRRHGISQAQQVLKKELVSSWECGGEALGKWSKGVMEYWSIGVLEMNFAKVHCLRAIAKLQPYSSVPSNPYTPSFHHSIIPLFHYSITPIRQHSDGPNKDNDEIKPPR